MKLEKRKKRKKKKKKDELLIKSIEAMQLLNYRLPKKFKLLRYDKFNHLIIYF